MTSALAQKAGLKLFEQNIKQYTPTDPLYETYTDAKGRERRRKREIPPGLSKRDIKILKSVKRRAHYLDKGFSICGMRFGWTFIIGIIPGAGDVADASLNYFLVLRKARQAEIPDWLTRKMLMNNVISASVGFVPFIGDIILAQYKANSRNAALLEEYLRIRGEEFLKLQNEISGNVAGTVPTAGKAGDLRPGAGAKQGENIVAPTKKQAIPEAQVPHEDRRPRTPGGTPLEADSFADVEANATTAGTQPKKSRWSSMFGGNKSTTATV